jgi:hypothetical protein
MNDIIISVHEATDEKKAFIRKKMKEKLDSQVKGFAQKLEGFDNLPINEIVETFLDSSKRLTSMVSISRNLRVNGYRDRLNGYKETVFFPRNCLAHGIAEELADGGYVFRHDGKEFTFNDESNVELRKSLRDFSSCLHDLQAEILAALPKTQQPSDES